MSTRRSWGSKQAYRVIHQPVSRGLSGRVQELRKLAGRVVLRFFGSGHKIWTRVQLCMELYVLSSKFTQPAHISYAAFWH